MAINSSVLAWRIAMDGGVHGVRKSETVVKTKHSRWVIEGPAMICGLGCSAYVSL